MNKGLLNLIGKLGQGKQDTGESISEGDGKQLVKWLVFSIAGKKFAIPSVQVREIINDVEVYHLPFVPDYIEGVMNRRGDPYTVIDPILLLGIEDNSAKKNPLFLVLEIPDDQVCIHIENILVFHKTESNALKFLKESENFFKGTINLAGEEIPVLNIDSFEKRLKKDLGNGDD